MLLYPIHQTLGQICGTMYYASGETKPSATISIVFMIISIPLSYALLASTSAVIPGLDLGSFGLALKMVVLQFLNVNVLAWWLAKIRNWKFDWSYQLITVAVLLFAGFASYKIAGFVPVVSQWLVLRAGISAALYASIAGLFYWSFPSLAGISREEIISNARGACCEAFRVILVRENRIKREGKMSGIDWIILLAYIGGSDWRRYTS